MRFIFILAACLLSGSLFAQDSLEALRGKPFPHFSFADMQEQPGTQELLQGKITVINFWYTGCGACLREMPFLNQLQAQYKEVQFLSFVNDADKKAIEKVFKKYPLHYRNFYNTGDFSRKLIAMYPTSIVLNKQGEVLGFTVGYSDRSRVELTDLIQTAISQ